MEKKRKRSESDAEVSEEIDAAVIELDVKRLVHQLDRCIKKNLMLRTKYAETPEKYVDSEVDLDDVIQRIGGIAASPENYPELVKLGAVTLLINTLAHENTDICGDTINLLNDLFGQDAPEQEEHVKLLADEFESKKGLTALVSTMRRFGSDDDGASSIFNVFSILENLIELKPETCTTLVRDTRILDLLLPMIAKDKPFQSDKQYAAEILAMMAQNSRDVQVNVTQGGGMDVILESIGAVRRTDPSSEDEREMVFDLFNVLCSCMQTEENKKLFLDAEGLELMLRLARTKKWLMVQSLKLIDFAVTSRKDSCERLVDIGALGLYFALMVKVTGKNAGTIHEYLLSTIVEMEKVLDGERRARLMWKMKEDDFKKLWTVVNIFADAYRLAYSPSVRTLDYTDRLERGLYRAQVSAQCIAYVTEMYGLDVTREMVLAVTLSVDRVVEVLEEMVENIADDEEEAAEKERCRRLLDGLRNRQGEGEKKNPS